MDEKKLESLLLNGGDKREISLPFAWRFSEKQRRPLRLRGDWESGSSGRIDAARHFEGSAIMAVMAGKSQRRKAFPARCGSGAFVVVCLVSC